jgi:hypothetical protein
MTYLKFIVWLSGLYFVYYSAMIIWDLMRSKDTAMRQQDDELTFAESFAPVRPEYELTMDDVKSPIVASGGVSLKRLFNLAQEEKVEYTSQVSFL